MKLSGVLVVALLAGCGVNLDNVCPYKTITQGVFGEVADASGPLEQGVEVDIYTMLNGVQGAMFAGGPTNRAGYQFSVDPSTYILCAKSVCTPVTIPTGLVEQSAVDAAAGLTWDAPVAVPPATSVGPCKYGG